jgi:hypothetical protein
MVIYFTIAFLFLKIAIKYILKKKTPISWGLFKLTLLILEVESNF